MSAIQLVVIVFAIAMAFATYRTYRRGDLLAPEAIVWATVWLGLIIVTAFPDAMRSFVGPLKVARLLDLVMIAAILLLTVLVFVLNGRVRRTERRIVELVRKLALSDEQSDGNRDQTVERVHEEPRVTGR